MKPKGFTLVELLVVIAIIGLLSTVAVVATNSSRDKARYVRVLGDVTQIAKAAEVYYSTSTTGYPADLGTGARPPELAPYLAVWPTPPCTGWTYDWENWVSGTGIQISVRRAVGTAVLRYEIFCSPSSSCTGGSEITSYSSKAITCNE
jgi:prepilin-type N-terminal cleavage/methylation domain-containing protein